MHQAPSARCILAAVHCRPPVCRIVSVSGAADGVVHLVQRVVDRTSVSRRSLRGSRPSDWTTVEPTSVAPAMCWILSANRFPRLARCRSGRNHSSSYASPSCSTCVPTPSNGRTLPRTPTTTGSCTATTSPLRRQFIARQFAPTFKEFPPAQKAASFTARTPLFPISGRTDHQDGVAASRRRSRRAPCRRDGTGACSHTIGRSSPGQIWIVRPAA